ncbi:MAG: DNA polymerase III subunit [Lachnospiraceae bacterium]|nr:DNA polymerase III subunit [Lachnospiraceae bacterium]
MRGFADIYGNELIKEQLKSGIADGRIQHAYMLTGEKGSGKRTMTEAFLLELFCTDKDEATGEPCMHCPECKKIMSGNHPDVIYITHEKEKTISVDEIRGQLMDTIDIKPFEGGYKVYIIPDAEKLSVQAQNALLKTLEEPPEYAVIILLAADDKQLLDTIRSRVVIEKMKPLTDSTITEYMQKKLGAEGEKLRICVAFSRGNLGRAIELYQSEQFSDWYQRLMKITRNIKNMDSVDIRIEIAKLRNSCPDIYEALDLLELWYRDLTMYMVTKDMNGLVFYGEAKALMAMASVSSYNGVQEIMNRIQVCRDRLNANVNPELSLELLFLTMKEK